MGLVSQEQYDYIQWKKEKIAEEAERMEHVHVGAVKEVQELLEKYGTLWRHLIKKDRNCRMM